MKHVTITLPDDMAQALDREARRWGTSASAVVREALTMRLRLRGDQERPLPFAALGRSGERDTAGRVDAILDADWCAEGDGGVPA
jgi:Arc/MetJ-type ribon-helix-helix transcriptional regulator